MVSILEYGADNTGVKDNFAVIENALKKESEIYFPSGKYLISKGIAIPSDRFLLLDEQAEIYCMDHCFDGEDGRFMIGNADFEKGNKNIRIEGGFFNGNNKNNARKTWDGGPNTGLMFSFMYVDGLTIKNVRVLDAETYHFRLGYVTNFVIEDVTIKRGTLTPCQDGVHLLGGCKKGVIKNIYAEKGSTNDDLIALNADDVPKYCQNREMKDGDIENIDISDIYAEDCWSAVRILSVKCEVKNVKITNLTAGVREFGVNMDANRQTADKLFEDEKFPQGVGCIENVTLENFTLWHADTDIKKSFWGEVKGDRPLIDAETNCKNFVVKNFTRNREKENGNTALTCLIKNIDDAEIIKNGERIKLPRGAELPLDDNSFDTLVINSLK